MSTFAELKTRLLTNPKVRAEYDALEAEFQLARELIAARARAGLTQEQLAERMQTTQSAIARIEGGRNLPSMRSLARYAEATGCRLSIRLEPR